MDTNHQGASGWPLVVSWAGNAVAYVLGGMSPLQVVALLLTIIYTAAKFYVLWRDKIATRTPGDIDD